MATKKIVQDMLKTFGLLYPTKSDLTDSVVETYFAILKRYSNEAIQKAGYKCLEELEFFPKPAEILKRLPRDLNEKHNKELTDRFTCPICKNYVSFIIEGKCEECHGGLPVSAGRKPHKSKYQRTTVNYIMQDQTRCQECGAITKCIKEPANAEHWKCRKCYTGLTGKEIADRYRDITKTMKTATLPECYERVPF